MTGAAATAEQQAVPDKIRPVLPAMFKLENVLAESYRAQIFNLLHSGGWRFGHKSSAKHDQFSFWHMHFGGHLSSRKQLKYDCAEEVKGKAPLIFAFWHRLSGTVFKGHTLIRCYANAQTYGSDGTTHTDSRADNCYTAVYYPHAFWDPSWGGETVLFNADKSDIIAAIYPRPNRLAIFKSNIPHAARGVSRICPELRITLMFKTSDGPIQQRGEDDD
jgi:SM-20-related protein